MSNVSVGKVRQPLLGMRTNSPPSFVDSIRIRRGDVRVLGRYILKAEAELAAMGLTVHQVTLDGLRDVLDGNIGSWGGVAPAFDCRQTTYDDADLGIFVAYDPVGRPVGACGQRYYDLGDTSLKVAIENLSFMYGDHETGDRRRIAFDVTAPAAATLGGRLTLLGGLWVHPSIRGSGLTCLLTNVTRAYALSQWDYQTEVLVGRNKLVRPDVMAQYGFTHREQGYRHTVDGVTVYDGHLLWTSADEVTRVLAAEVEAMGVEPSSGRGDREQLASA